MRGSFGEDGGKPRREQGAQHADQGQRLFEHRVVAGRRNLDVDDGSRNEAAYLGGHVLGDQAVLGADHGKRGSHLREEVPDRDVLDVVAVVTLPSPAVTACPSDCSVRCRSSDGGTAHPREACTGLKSRMPSSVEANTRLGLSRCG